LGRPGVPPPEDKPVIEEAVKLAERVRRELGKVIVGQEEAVTLLLVGFLVRGHILLEGVPGLAKTLLAKALAHVLQCRFTRIQFTPDLMPADIVGTPVFDFKSRTFRLRKGPIFTEILLADEINRTPPKTQSALLEAMEERQVSIEGRTFLLPERFFVVATQNPIEQEGTYPLPEAQLDRFLLKVLLDYPTAPQEREILHRYGTGAGTPDLQALGVNPLPQDGTMERCMEAIRRIRVEKGIIGYVQALLEATRRSPHLHLGASPRGGIALLRAAKCLAALSGRDFITPDDVKSLALSALRHRVILRPEAELEGLNPDRILSRILEEIPVPR